MILGKIYLYVNKINGKKYIGQTIRSIEKRHQRHLQDSKNDNLYFHRALIKYGEENFSLSILEDNIPADILDEKEKYYIKQYDSFYLNNKGYNMTQGGKWGSAPRKLSDKDIEEIQELLFNTTSTFQEIGQDYNVSLSCISDISTGRTWKNTRYDYPIRSQVEKSIVTKEKFEKIINLLQLSTLSYKEIAEEVQTLEYTVGEINRGTNTWCKKIDLSFPVRKPVKSMTYQNILTENDVKHIIYLLIFSKQTLQQISEQYGVGKNTIGNISRGTTWKEYSSLFKLPLRTRAEENQSIYNQLMV